MRKDDFKTSNPKLKFEVGVGTGQSGIRMGYPSKDDLKEFKKELKNKEVILIQIKSINMNQLQNNQIQNQNV